MTDAKPLAMTAPNAGLVRRGIKTQTRRIIKHTPDDRDQEVKLERGWFMVRRAGVGWCSDIRCPYDVGQLCWIREPWRTLKALDHLAPSALAAPHRDGRLSAPIHFIADAHTWIGMGRYRHGRFMPRWASRTTVEVMEVRVERLQDISRGDAMDEGCPFPNMAEGPDPRQWYAELWDSINGPDSWAMNPWVWCITLRQIHAVLTPLRNDVPRNAESPRHSTRSTP